jgi:hypothetical protein
MELVFHDYVCDSCKGVLDNVFSTKGFVCLECKIKHATKELFESPLCSWEKCDFYGKPYFVNGLGKFYLATKKHGLKKMLGVDTIRKYGIPHIEDLLKFAKTEWENYGFRPIEFALARFERLDTSTKDVWLSLGVAYDMDNYLDDLKRTIKTTTQCLKVDSLRKESGDPDMNLEKWMKNPKNVYVGRPGRVFIGTGDSKRVYHYPGSKFANPFKVGAEYQLDTGLEIMTLSVSLDLYEVYLKTSGLLDEIEELRGKNLGCFCDQSGDCHAKVLVRYLNKRRF